MTKLLPIAKQWGGGPPSDSSVVEGPAPVGPPIESSFNGPPPRPSAREELRAARASSFASQAVTSAPLASSARTVASPDRAKP